MLLHGTASCWMVRMPEDDGDNMSEQDAIRCMPAIAGIDCAGLD